MSFQYCNFFICAINLFLPILLLGQVRLVPPCLGSLCLCTFSLIHPSTSKTWVYEVSVQWESSCNIDVTMNGRDVVNEMSQKSVSYVGMTKCVNVHIDDFKFFYAVDPPFPLSRNGSFKDRALRPNALMSVRNQ